MKKLIMTAILAPVFVAGMAFNAAPASATRQDPNKCYEEVTIYGDIIEKETRTKTSNDHGQTWSEYGPWTDWPDAGPVNDDGRNRGPAFHGEDNNGRDRWYRQYRYVVKGQFVKGTKMEEVPCPTVPETTQPPETTVPETTVPETTVPETTLPPETTQPPTTVPETTTPVTTAPETTVVVTDPPATTTPPPTGQRLPDTGNENWVIAILATILLLGGTGLTLLTRRS